MVAKRFDQYPSTIWYRVFASFRVHFPEYGYNHPVEIESSDYSTSDHHKLKLMVMLAVMARYIEQDTPGQDLAQHSFIADELQRHLTDPPSLALVQAYHLMGLWEWGEGRTYSAWIHIGIAVRMLQALLATPTQTHITLPRASRSLVHQVSEVESRTYWACALLDKLVSNGRGRPTLLPWTETNLPFPISDHDFVFDPLTAADPTAQPLVERGGLDHVQLGILEAEKPAFIRIIATGMHIWSKIHQWIALGGRTQEGMVDLANSPWRQTSKWARMREELRLWRNAHHPRYSYPDTSVIAHAHLHQAEAFVSINLIYYLSIILLNREFIPFLPTGQNRYRGPLDAPLFQEEAPDGWWEGSSEELFLAVSSISGMMRPMQHVNPRHYTPFTGICIFTATLMNMYATKFPAMSRSGREKPEVLMNENMDDLSRFSKLWKMGRGLLDVVGVMGSLYDLTVRHEARLTSHSRENYGRLESTIDLSQDFDIRVPELVAEASVRHDCNKTSQEEQDAQTVPVDDHPRQYRQEPLRSAQRQDLQEPLWISDGVTDLFEGGLTGLPDTWPLVSETPFDILQDDAWRQLIDHQDV